MLNAFAYFPFLVDLGFFVRLVMHLGGFRGLREDGCVLWVWIVRSGRGGSHLCELALEGDGGEGEYVQ